MRISARSAPPAPFTVSTGNRRRSPSAPALACPTVTVVTPGPIATARVRRTHSAAEASSAWSGFRAAASWYWRARRAMVGPSGAATWAAVTSQPPGATATAVPLSPILRASSGSVMRLPSGSSSASTSIVTSTR